MKKFENALNNDRCYIYNKKDVTLREATILIASEGHITVQDNYKINSYNIYKGASIIGGEPGEVILSSRSTIDWLAIEDYGVNKDDLMTALYNFRVQKREPKTSPTPNTTAVGSAPKAEVDYRVNTANLLRGINEVQKDYYKTRYTALSEEKRAEIELDSALDNAIEALSRLKGAIEADKKAKASRVPERTEKDLKERLKERLKEKFKEFIDKL